MGSNLNAVICPCVAHMHTHGWTRIHSRTCSLDGYVIYASATRFVLARRCPWPSSLSLCRRRHIRTCETITRGWNLNSRSNRRRERTRQIISIVIRILLLVHVSIPTSVSRRISMHLFQRRVALFTTRRKNRAAVTRYYIKSEVIGDCQRGCTRVRAWVRRKAS